MTEETKDDKQFFHLYHHFIMSDQEQAFFLLSLIVLISTDKGILSVSVHNSDDVKTREENYVTDKRRKIRTIGC